MIRQSTSHGNRLYVPGDSDPASLWAVHAEGHAYPEVQDNALSESWAQVPGESILRPADSPVSDSVWSVDSSGANPVYRPSMAAAFDKKAYRENLTGTVNGSNTVFTVSRAIDSDLPVAVTANGALTSAEVTGASELTLDEAPATGDVPWAVYWSDP